jgi:hypothetical protein
MLARTINGWLSVPIQVGIFSAKPGALTRSAERGEADRARALLWSLDGESGAAIGARLGVRADRVR